ncbi:hypothetical protein PybrP1_004548, partial [[Pythium] brassicae (nom. inval.)]
KRGRESGLDLSGSDAPAFEKPRDAQRVRTENGAVSKRWTPEQDEALRQAVSELGQRNWMDNLLMETMLKGYDSWREVAAQIPGRTAKQCRERWRNRLDPNINKAPFTENEDNIIQQAYEKLGNRWTQIAELLPGRTEDSVKLRWKTLNPNQRTYTKLGRPRLLPTDQIDHPELGFSSPLSGGGGGYLASGDHSGIGYALEQPAAMSTPPTSSESSSNNHPHEYRDDVSSPYDVKAESGPGDVLPEPIVRGDDSDEEMSSEDIVIFKAFLRGQSSGSMRLDGSFRNLLAELPEDVAKNYPSLAGISGASARSLQRGSSISWAPIEATAAEARPRNKQLVSMMSLGSVRSASLRSLTENDAYFGDDLNRQLSGMSLIEGLAGDADDAGNQEPAAAGGEFISKMNSFEDAQLIAETMLPAAEPTKRSFTEQLNGATSAVDGGSQQQINEELLKEFLQFPSESGGGAAGPGGLTTTVSVQDFYNGDVALDLLAAADRFEI